MFKLDVVPRCPSGIDELLGDEAVSAAPRALMNLVHPALADSVLFVVVVRNDAAIGSTAVKRTNGGWRFFWRSRDGSSEQIPGILRDPLTCSGCCRSFRIPWRRRICPWPESSWRTQCWGTLLFSSCGLINENFQKTFSGNQFLKLIFLYVFF